MLTETADGFKRLKTPAALADEFSAVDLGAPLALHCGSGLTACTVALGLEQLGGADYALFDGSWAEWGAA
jgi:thiosulfate/3-mercaptopyruvate sulfurtransferase